MSERDGRILVVDDKETMRQLLARILGDRHEVVVAPDGAAALAMLGARAFDVVLTDVRMPGADGFEVVRAVKEHWPTTEVVMMTAYASIEMAVEAIRRGAYDYLPKPFDPDDVALVVARALEHKRLRERADTLRRAPEPPAAFAGFVGDGAAMRRLYAQLQQAAEADITVLLTGESGTGKELAARAIHARGARHAAPFVAVNCGALPPALVESELFGHVRGAFTDAGTTRDGLFQAAQDGTLFLDEIGELPLEAQVKLNRALQEREVRRVGENTAVPVNVRLVAATNRDLRTEIAAGRFREDLFYRLAVFAVHLPPLREHADDVASLASHFLRRHAAAQRRPVEGFEPAALRGLAVHRWPGNVRELENAVERAVAVARGALVTTADLPAAVRGEPPPAPDDARAAAPEGGALAALSYKEAVAQARDRSSREYLVALLRAFAGNVTQAAERAGIERESLHRLLKRYGLRAEDYRDADAG